MTLHCSYFTEIYTNIFSSQKLGWRLGNKDKIFKNRQFNILHCMAEGKRNNCEQCDHVDLGISLRHNNH